MLGFVMPCFHAEPGTEAAAQESDSDETGFRDTPFVMAGFPFIDAIEKESHEVNRREVDQKAV